MQRQVWCNFLILFLYFQMVFRWEKDDLCYVAVVCTQYLITSLASPVVNVISLISLPLVPCFYNLRKQGHKVVAVQKIVIKLFHIYLWSCLLLKKLTQNIRWYFCDIVSAWLLPTPNCNIFLLVRVISVTFEMFCVVAWNYQHQMATPSYPINPTWTLSYSPFLSHISICLKVEAESVSFWLFHFTSICLMWSRWLALDFNVALSTTCGSSESLFGASNIFIQAFNLATSAANSILWVSNSNDCLLCILPSALPC